MKEKEIKIKLDYSHGPIWKEHFDITTGEWKTGINCIDQDKALQLLNDEAERMYSALYSFDDDNPCQFDEDKFNIIKGQLLSIIQTIILRLNAIQDGSFYISDEASKELIEQAIKAS